VAARGFEIAEGYLDIQADTDQALKDVRRFFKEVDGELEAEEKAFKKSGQQSGKNYGEGIAVGMDSRMLGLKPMRKVMEDLDREARIAAHDIGEHIGHDIGKALSGAGGGGTNRRGLISRLLGGGGTAIRSLGRGLSGIFSGASSLFSSISSGIADAFKSGVDQAKQIWKSTSEVFSQIGTIGGGIGAVGQFAAYGVAIPAALGLAGALLQLSAAALALPAAIGVAVAAIAPLIIAFKGVGEAIGAGLSGDVEKFNEALKGLTPSAQRVVKEFVSLGPALKNIKKLVQESLFNQLVGQVGKLGTALLPTLATGLSSVAGALGHLIKLFIGLVTAPDTIATINNLFATTTRIVDMLAEPLINLLGGVFDLINAGLPFVERFVGVLANGMQDAANWLAEVTSNGDVAGWLERAWNIGKKLWDVLKGLGEYAFILLNSFGDEGTDTLNGLGDALAKMNAYLKSDEGAETLHNLGVLVHWAGNAFVWFISQATGAWRALNAVFDFVRGIGPFFSKLGSDIAGIAQSVGHWFADLGRSIWSGISGAGSAIGDFFGGIWDGLVAAYNAVVSFGGAVVDWFVALPGMIGDFFMALPGMIGSFFQNLYNQVLYGIGYLGGLMLNFWIVTVPGWFRDAWNWAYAYTVEGLSRTWANIQAFPGQVWSALQSLGTFVGNAFQTAWNWAYSYTVEGAQRTWANIQAFPGRVWSALSGIQSMLNGIFSRAWDSASSAVRTGIDNLMSFVRAIPGRIQSALSNAGSWLYNLGKDIIRGLVDGIGDALSWAVDAARNAASRIKRGFMEALDSHSPSQVMRKEVGRTILPGVQWGIEDTLPSFERYLGATADMISGGMRPSVTVAAPNVSVGGVTLLADLGDGIRRAVPVVLMENAPTVAAAADVGNRQRAGWVNTARTAVVGGTR
jgi:phage-related protein